MGGAYYVLFHDNNCHLTLRYMGWEAHIIFFFLSVIESIEDNVNVQSPIHPSWSSHIIFHCVYLHELTRLFLINQISMQYLACITIKSETITGP